MKQAEIEHIYESKRNVIYPIYSDRKICTKVCERIGYDLNQIVDKEYNKITRVHTFGKYDFDFILFVGLGDSSLMNATRYQEVVKTLAGHIDCDMNMAIKGVVCDSLDIHHVAKLTLETYLVSCYQEWKVNHEKPHVHDLDLIAAKEKLDEDVCAGRAFADGINYARYLSDKPSNYMTPSHLVEEAKTLAKEYGLECDILDKEQLEKMQAGGILAVNQGSHVPAYMIVLKYNHGGNQPYSAVVGKGLTFDSGGYNIKSNSYGMKYDMCGGADVFGIMQIIASLKLPINVYGIIPTTENLINGSAYKPQDVITTLSKKTVEIVSTDAEGRLILCDALTYAQQLGAKKIIDLATLTGACVSALGHVYTGVFSNNDDFYHEFENAMKQSNEKGWRLPMDDEYMKLLKSNSADFKNSVGKVGAGASVAANFLNEFVDESVAWIHLDIAGSANLESGATGAMIRSVVNVLKP